MTNIENITKALEYNAEPSRMAEIDALWKPIASRIPGWSGNLHYLFFKSLFEASPEIKTMLMLGVYMGRDIAIILDATKGRPLQVVGVDRFKDMPCEDWHVDLKRMSWTEAGFGPAPDAKKALDNINPQEPHQVRLIESDTLDWLPSVTGKFDFIYVDTSHEYETVKRELELIRPLCHEKTIIAGDDYTNAGKEWWGVDRAVKEAFTNHQVVMNMIWYASVEEFK